MKRYAIAFVIVFSISVFQTSFAQFYAGPFFGFKSYSLKAAGTITQNGQRQAFGVQDGGGTVFDFGGFGAYTIVTSGIYNLDIEFKTDYSTIGFFENGYNSLQGAGALAAAGASGARTHVFEWDLLGINRFAFHKFKVLEPYLGVGMSFGLYSTSDLSVTPQGQTQAGSTFTGNSEFKIGLSIVYGTYVRVAPGIYPFIQLSHLLSFGSTTELLNDTKYTWIFNDTPGYFALSAGVRFDF